MNEPSFDADGLRKLVDELVRRLDARGISAEIHIVGGSAMALLFPDDPSIRVTRDVDAAFEPADVIRLVIDEMSGEFDLPKNWMNSNAKPFMPPRAIAHSAQSPVAVSVATVEELIAMKLAASREQDLHDLGILARHANIDDPARIVEIAFEQYGEDSVVLSESREEYLLIAAQALGGR